MSQLYYIKETSNELIAEENPEDQLTRIEYDKGRWKLIKDVSITIMINDRIICSDTLLDKYDKIEINSKKMNWSNYLYEGETQELYLRDFIKLNGRISRSNFRILLLLIIGLTPCIFFLPELIVALLYNNRRDGQYPTPEQVDLVVKNIAPIIWITLGALLTFFLLNISIKRMRDTGNPLWKILIPIENLRILFTEKSKR